MAFPRFTTEPALVLAPMEGITDAPMRALQSEIGAFTHCVSEFIRISQNVLPARVFKRLLPELSSGAVTERGLPVQVQLLGGDPERMALSALQAIKAGANAIDINFGCPAPTVNRNDGGATLLKYPDRIREIVSAVRQAVPREMPVSAKLRLGWDDIGQIHVNAERAALGGADWIVIHGRTRLAGYVPPAYWKPIGEVRKALDIPVIANGEIWTVDDFERCREESGCNHFMLGRGALADPWLSHRIAERLFKGSVPFEKRSVPQKTDSGLAAWMPWVRRFVQLSEKFSAGSEFYTLARVKQWFRIAGGRRTVEGWDEIKQVQSLAELEALVRAH